MASKPILKVTGQLDKKTTEIQIQKQLNEISKSLKLTINVNKTSEKMNQSLEKSNKLVTTGTTKYSNFTSEISDNMRMQMGLANSLEKVEGLRRKEILLIDKQIAKAKKQIITEEDYYRKNITNLKTAKTNADSLVKTMSHYGSAEQRRKASQINAEIQKLAITENTTEKEVKNTNARLKEQQARLRAVSNEAKATGKNALKLSEMAKVAARSFMLWISVTGIFFRAIAEIKRGIGMIAELDKSLLELRKVTELTGTAIEDFTHRAQGVALEVGRTTSEVTKATAAFARMGFAVSESLKLAQDALLLTNIGDGIEDVTQSTEVLISTIKGFGLEANESRHIIDALNEVSNNYAVNTSDLAEGIKRVSSVMAMSGDSMEQTIGMLTGMIEIMQDAPKASTGLRTVSLRLRGLSEDGEKLGHTFQARLNDSFERIAKVSIMTNGKLKSTYDIVTELGAVWHTLTNEQRAYLAQEAAGKRQAQSFQALMMNSETIIKATASALDSQGSALVENEKYLDSISGKIEVFTATAEKMWTNAISSEGIKRVIDFGTAIVSLTDKIGLLNIVFAAFAVAFYHKAITSVVKGLLAMQVGVTTLGATIATFLPYVAIVSLAIINLNRIVKHFVKTVENSEEKIASYSNEINILKTKKELLIAKTEELTTVEKDELTVIDDKIERLRHKKVLEEEELRRLEKKVVLVSNSNNLMSMGNFLAEQQYQIWKKNHKIEADQLELEQSRIDNFLKLNEAQNEANISYALTLDNVENLANVYPHLSSTHKEYVKSFLLDEKKRIQVLLASANAELLVIDHTRKAFKEKMGQQQEVDILIAGDSPEAVIEYAEQLKTIEGLLDSIGGDSGSTKKTSNSTEDLFTNIDRLNKELALSNSYIALYSQRISEAKRTGEDYSGLTEDLTKELSNQADIILNLIKEKENLIDAGDLTEQEVYDENIAIQNLTKTYEALKIQIRSTADEMEKMADEVVKDVLSEAYEDEVKAIEKARKVDEKYYDNKINGIQSQIDKIKEVTEQNEYELDIQNKLKDIEQDRYDLQKKQQELADVKKEKIRVFTGEKFEYVEDVVEVKKVQDDIDEINRSMVEHQLDLDRIIAQRKEELRIKELESKIQMYEEEKKLEDERRDEELVNLEIFYTRTLEIIDKSQVSEMLLIETFLGNLTHVEAGKYLERLGNLSGFYEEYMSTLNGLDSDVNGVLASLSGKLASAVSNLISLQGANSEIDNIRNLLTPSTADNSSTSYDNRVSMTNTFNGYDTNAVSHEIINLTKVNT